MGRAKGHPMSRRAMPRLRAAFGRRLLELRRARGLSQDRLGVRTGLSGKFLGEVERGEKSISLDNLARVARAVGVSLEAMVEGLEARKGIKRRDWGV